MNPIRLASPRPAPSAIGGGLGTHSAADLASGESASADRPRTSMSGAGSRKRWRRRLGRALAIGATGLGTLAIALWVGWRYGVEPLPRPAAGVDFVRTAPLAWSAVGPENCWYWAREADRFIRAGRMDWQRRFQEMYLLTVDSWARSGARAGVSQQEAEQWFREQPQFGRLFERAASAPDNQPPAGLGGAEVRAMLLLKHLPLIQAAAAERSGNTVEALEHLTDAWRLQARFVPHVEFSGVFDERGLAEVEDKLGRPWRRLTSAGAGLTAADARRLLQRLDDITNALPDLTLSYQRLISARLDTDRRTRRPDWGRVRRALSQAITLAIQDLVQIPPALWARLSGYNVNLAHVEGVGHFARPLGLFWEALQKSSLRPGDVDTAVAAAASQALARLGAAAPVRIGPRPGLNLWQRWFDRPALWRLLSSLPDGTDLRRSRAQWLVYFEVCRLALALRIYREEHGDWPTDLGRLRGGVLPTVPMDPRSGQPFGYERTTRGWRLISPGGVLIEGAIDLSGNSGRLVFRSGDD